MAEKEAIFSDTKIKWVGIIDLSVFYKKLQEWLKIKKYSTLEKKYVERIKPNGKTIEIVWECTRKDVDYFNFIINVEFNFIGVNDAEVERDGKRIKLSKVEAELKISSHILKDPKDNWKTKPYMRNLYETYIIKHKIEEAKIECYKNTSDFIEEIKNYFALYSLK